MLSSVQLFGTPWTVARQAPLSVGFSWEEYWSGLSFPSPGDLPNPGIQLQSLVSPTLQTDSLPLNHWRSPGFGSISFLFFVLKQEVVSDLTFEETREKVNT